MISARILRQLEQIDWDFSTHLPGTTKSIHWYPGTFPSDLPTTLIQALTKPGDLVIDPYGGVGTTALEALRQGRKAWIVEANPIGCLVAYVAGGVLLLKGANPKLPAMLIQMVRGIVLRSLGGQSSPALIETDSKLAGEVDLILKRLIKPTPLQFSQNYSLKPNSAKLGNWIEDRTLKNIEKLLLALNEDDVGVVGRLLGVTMVSAILRPSSSQTKSWGHIADNVRPKEFVPKDVLGLCLRWLSRLETIVEMTEVARFSHPAKQELRYWVSAHNWLLPSLPGTSPDTEGQLIVTSPPYADAIDYTLAQRLSLYALGLEDEDLAGLCRGEIGARRKRFDSGSHSVWASALSESLVKQTKTMGKPSVAAFVLPHKDAGREQGNIALKEGMVANGWEQVLEIDRSIRQMRVRQSWTSIKKETICIFGRMAD